jgi:hypothetical protein
MIGHAGPRTGPPGAAAAAWDLRRRRNGGPGVRLVRSVWLGRGGLFGLRLGEGGMLAEPEGEQGVLQDGAPHRRVFVRAFAGSLILPVCIAFCDAALPGAQAAWLASGYHVGAWPAARSKLGWLEERRVTVLTMYGGLPTTGSFVSMPSQPSVGGGIGGVVRAAEVTRFEQCVGGCSVRGAWRVLIVCAHCVVFVGVCWRCLARYGGAGMGYGAGAYGGYGAGAYGGGAYGGYGGAMGGYGGSPRGLRRCCLSQPGVLRRGGGLQLLGARGRVQVWQGSLVPSELCFERFVLVVWCGVL